MKLATFERRSAGPGSKGPRYWDWALVATASPRHFLLIRRSISDPTQLAYFFCYVPEPTPATLSRLVTIAGRRWPVEQDFQLGKSIIGWDTSQARTWHAYQRHTALSALALAYTAAAQAQTTTLATGATPDNPPPADPPPAPPANPTPPTAPTRYAPESLHQFPGLIPSHWTGYVDHPFRRLKCQSHRSRRSPRRSLSGWDRKFVGGLSGGCGFVDRVLGGGLVGLGSGQ
jgi:hypothetical protein